MPEEPLENQSDNPENEQGDSPQNQPDPVPSPENAAGDSGELSQADIDAALNAAAEGAESATPDAGDSSGELSQSDIDAALQQASEATAPEPPAEEGISQADIDAALADLDNATQAAAESEPDSAQSIADAAIEEAAQAADEVETPADERLDSAGRPFDDIAAAMAAAIEEEAAEPAPSAPAAPEGPQPQALDVPDFSAAPKANSEQDISILRDVSLRVHVELGRTKMFIEDVLKLGEGSVVELENLAGDPVDVYVNGRLIARGEVLVLSDNFCVRISEIVQGLQDVSAA